MAGKRTVEYPSWVEKYRGKGRTIRKTGGGYGLYRCTSERDEKGKVHVLQEYLGMITKEDGFIPKRTADAPVILEYGLSHLIWKNFSGALKRHTFMGDTEVVKLGIIQFLFGEANPLTIHSSCLTLEDAATLTELATRIRPSRIQTSAEYVEKHLRERIPDPVEYRMVTQMLMLCTAERTHGLLRKADPPQEVLDILKKHRLRF